MFLVTVCPRDYIGHTCTRKVSEIWIYLDVPYSYLLTLATLSIGGTTWTMTVPLFVQLQEGVLRQASVGLNEKHNFSKEKLSSWVS